MQVTIYDPLIQIVYLREAMEAAQISTQYYMKHGIMGNIMDFKFDRKFSQAFVVIKIEVKKLVEMLIGYNA